MPLISKRFITDKLLNQLDLESFIAQYVEIKKKSGANATCCCPFHNEKTPSFVIYKKDQSFHCFGCKAHGNAIDFIMRLKNLSFVDAVEECAKFANLTIEYEEGSNPQSKKQDDFNLYYELLDRCAAFFCAELHKNKEALDYFKVKRSLSDETVVNARLGFAPDSWDAVLKLIPKNQNEVSKLIDLGVLLNKNGKIYSMFRNRVMIPIFDKKGRIISFGGRSLGDEKPKYLNTAESPIFRKRNELFGLYEALLANNNRPQKIVLVEGYMDVIALRQHGINYAVASLGTSTTKEHFELMFRYTDKVVCCYDGDDAGRHAAERALEVVTPALKENKEVSFAFIPSGDDPDSLVRSQGKNAFISILDKALSYPEFLIQSILNKGYNLNKLNEKATFIDNVIHSVANIQVDALRLVCINLLASIVNYEQTQLMQMLMQKAQKIQNKGSTEVIKENPKNSDLLKTPMRRLIAFILCEPTLVGMFIDKLHLDHAIDLLRDFKLAGVEELKFFLEKIKENPNINSSYFIEITRGTPRERYVHSLMSLEKDRQGHFNDKLSLEERGMLFIDLLTNTFIDVLKKRLQELINKGNGINKNEEREITLIGQLINKK